jgi:hypothetical protein
MGRRKPKPAPRWACGSSESVCSSRARPGTTTRSDIGASEVRRKISSAACAVSPASSSARAAAPAHVGVPRGEEAGEIAQGKARAGERAEEVVGRVLAERRQERRHVEEHGQRAVLGVERQRQAPLLHPAVYGRALRRLDDLRMDAVCQRARLHRLVEGIEDHRPLGLDQLGVGAGGGGDQRVGVVEQHAEVADPAHAGVEAGRSKARLEARIAEDALLRLCRGPVVEHLLVGAGGDAHPPRAALVLRHQHRAVLTALVDGAGRAGRHAGRVDAVVADAGQVEEGQLLDLRELIALRLGERGEVGIVGRVQRRAAQVVVPVRPGADLHRLAVDHRDGAGGGLVVAGGGGEQLVVAVGPRLVIVVQYRQRRIVEQARERGRLSALAEGELSVLALPAALVAILVLPEHRIAGARPGLDVVPPRVLHAAPVGPLVLACDAARMAADALVEVEDRGHLRAHVHGQSPVRRYQRGSPSSLRTIT